MKSFKFWKRYQVQEAFDLKRVETLERLTNWLTVDVTSITPTERERIEELQKLLRRNILDWNEAELKFNFLGPLMLIVNFYTEHYRPFAERSLTVKVGKETSSGYIDFLVASGEQVPKAPYFCLHEYKPEEGTSNDPLGQLLIAMVAAQQANQVIEKQIPIYGTYTIGRNFYFVVLDDKKFAVSDSYPSTQEDIFEIFCIFRKLKVFLGELTN